MQKKLFLNNLKKKKTMKMENDKNKQDDNDKLKYQKFLDELRSNPKSIDGEALPTFTDIEGLWKRKNQDFWNSLEIKILVTAIRQQSGWTWDVDMVKNVVTPMVILPPEEYDQMVRKYLTPFKGKREKIYILLLALSLRINTYPFELEELD